MIGSNVKLSCMYNVDFGCTKSRTSHEGCNDERTVSHRQKHMEIEWIEKEQ